MATELEKILAEAEAGYRTPTERMVYEAFHARTPEQKEHLRKTIAMRKAIKKLETERAAKTERVPDKLLTSEHKEGGTAIWKQRFKARDWQGTVDEINRILANPNIKLNEKHKYALNLTRQKALNAMRDIGTAVAEPVEIPKLRPEELPPFIPKPAGYYPQLPEGFTPRPQPKIPDPLEGIKFEGMGLFG